MASIEHGEVTQMSTAMADVSTANHFVRKIEDAESKRQGRSIDEVRPNIAARLSIAPGTLENIRRYRSKVIPNWLMDRLRAEAIRILQSEIQGLEHEISIARQVGSNHRDNTLAEAEASLAAARGLLHGEVK